MAHTQPGRAKVLELTGGAIRAGSRTLALGVLLLLAPPAFAELPRVEITAGQCSYGKGNDGSWWKEGYEASFNLSVPCGGVAISSTPWGLGTYKIGWRLGWYDLGRPNAITKAPVLDAEANSHPTGENCNVLTGSGCVGLYKQTGGAYGLALSAITERKFGDFTFGAEVGLYNYRSWWFVFGEHPANGTCSSCYPMQQQYTWDYARGNHTTSLIGATAEWEGWFLHVRRYSSIMASNAEINSLYHGLIGGPLTSVSAGYQFKWQ